MQIGPVVRSLLARSGGSRRRRLASLRPDRAGPPGVEPLDRRELLAASPSTILMLGATTDDSGASPSRMT